MRDQNPLNQAYSHSKECEQLQKALELIKQIEMALTCGAAEYVPAIRDVFDLIDKWNRENKGAST